MSRSSTFRAPTRNPDQSAAAFQAAIQVQAQLFVHAAELPAQRAAIRFSDPLDGALQSEQHERERQQIDHLRRLCLDPLAAGPPAELHSIVALVVYVLGAWLLGKLVWLLLGETRSAVKTTSSSVETRR